MIEYDLLTISDGGDWHVDFSDERLREVWYVPKQGDGETVQETIAVSVAGTPDEIRDWMLEAEQVLEAASQQAQDSVGRTVYLRLRHEAGTQTWQSRIIAGRVVRCGGGQLGSDQRLRGTLRVCLEITRPDYWEAATAVSLASGTTVYNGCQGSAGQANSFVIGGNTIEGSLPAPIALELKNTSGAEVGDIWVGCDGRLEGGADNQFEAEDMIDLGSGVSQVADSTCSEGACLAVNGSSGSEKKVGEVVLRAATLLSAKNRIYRILGALREVSAGVYGFVKLVYGGTVLACSPTVPLENGVVDFGVFLLPPWFYDADMPYDPANVSLEFYYVQQSGTPAFKLDFLKALPVDSGYLHFEDTGIGLGANQVLKHENGRCITYVTNAIGGMYFRSHRRKGAPLQVHPGSDARLHFVWARSGGGMDASDTLEVSVSYRPRVRIL